MSVIVKVFGVSATIDGYHWTSEFEELANMLNAMLDPDGPSGADPFPDHTAATDAVEKLDGKIISFDEPSFDPDVIY